MGSNVRCHRHDVFIVLDTKSRSEASFGGNIHKEVSKGKGPEKSSSLLARLQLPKISPLETGSADLITKERVTEAQDPP